MGTSHKVCASCGYVIDGATRESYEAEIERLREERDDAISGYEGYYTARDAEVIALRAKLKEVE